MDFKNLMFSEESRLIFGKKELLIVKKQLNGEKLSQSEKNVLSRSIRKKFEFIKKISKFEDKFKLEHNIDNKKLIFKTVDLILKDKYYNNVKSIFLFGSFSDKTNTFRSDIDICVLFDKKLNKKEIFDFRLRILSELPDKIDLQIYQELPYKIKQEIIKNHKILYKRKDFNRYDFIIKNIKDNSYLFRMNKFFAK